jgi:hypothetical protein
MHVVQFLPQLAQTVHVEMVEARLPKLLQSLRILRESPAKLSFEEFRRAHRQLVRNPLLQYLQRRRGRTSLWFAEQEVHVLRHHPCSARIRSNSWTKTSRAQGLPKSGNCGNN